MNEVDVTIVRSCAAQLVSYVRAHIARCFGLEWSEVKLPNLRSESVTCCVTLRRNGAIRACYAATHSTLPGSLEKAAERALRDSRFGGCVTLGEIDVVTIEVWILQSKSRVERVDKVLVEGSVGVELKCGEKNAFYLPSVAPSHGISAPAELLTRLCRKAGLRDRQWQSPQATLLQAKWLHFAETASGTMEFLRCRPNGELRTGRAMTMSTIARLAKHMRVMQYCDGKPVYLYDPRSDSKVDGGGHPVRLVSVYYALARLISEAPKLVQPELMPDALETTTRRGMAWIARHVMSCGDHTDHSWLIGEINPNGYLGCTAFAVMAMQCQKFRYEYRTVRRRLVLGLLSCQDSDGWFPESVLRSRVVGDQRFYPGESLLALAIEYSIAPSRKIELTFRRAYGFYSRMFAKNPDPYLAAWQAKAWSAFFLCNPLPRYAAFVFRMLDWLVPMQYSVAEQVSSDFSGGFVLPGEPRGAMPTFVGALFTEAFVYGFAVAVSVGDSVRAGLYREIVERGVAFVSRLQICPEFASSFGNPALACGGITCDLSNYVVRCDFNSHAMTCLLGYMARGLLTAR